MGKKKEVEEKEKESKNEKRFICDICKKETSSRSGLTRHYTSAHYNDINKIKVKSRTRITPSNMLQNSFISSSSSSITVPPLTYRESGVGCDEVARNPSEDIETRRKEWGEDIETSDEQWGTGWDEPPPHIILTNNP